MGTITGRMTHSIPHFIEIEKADTMTADQIHKEANKAAASNHNNLTISDAQKEAGTYKKGHIKIQGLDITIENPKDSFREGTSKAGKKWKTKLNHHYGYIKSTQGKDKDHVDCFIGDKPESDKVFIVNQINPDSNQLDEHKCMIGFENRAEAKAAYLSNYEKGWKGLGLVKEMSMDEFKKWVYDADKTSKIAKSVIEAPRDPGKSEVTKLLHFIPLSSEVDNVCSAIIKNDDLFELTKSEKHQAFIKQVQKSHSGLVPKKVTVNRHGKTFTQTFWVSPDEGNSLDEHVRAIAKERGLYIPPAWHSLQINKDPKAGCQIKGINVKGKAVYVRTKQYNDENAAAKFARLKAFSAQFPKLEKHLSNNLKTSEEAKVLYLITKTGFRVGSEADTKADVQAYGASTLHSNHVKVAGSKVSFDFTGKKGVHQDHEVTDPKIASMMKNKSGKIFDTDNSKVLSYLKDIVGQQFKVKDIRTYVATDTAIKHANTLPRPTNDKEFKKFQKDVCEVVSKKLGNSPAMAKSAYIDPAVWDEFKKGYM